MRYRKRPVIIEAEQFICYMSKAEQRVNSRAPDTFLGLPIHCDEKGAFLLIKTLEGELRANNGDWIITGIRGERYPCKPDVFEATYERVEPVAEEQVSSENGRRR